MAELGHIAVVLAFGAAVYAAVASAVGATRDLGELVLSGRRGLLAAAMFASVAAGALVYSFVAHDFSVGYVWQTSSTTTPSLYLLTGLWGGQSGSLLFWSFLLAVFAAAVLLMPWRADAALMPWFTAVCAAVLAFFLFLVAFVADPFQRLAVVPAEGNGLNPLLQHPGMAFHPPALYLGFTGMTIPFAFAMAALLSRRTDAGWIKASRRWTLVAWAFLTIGLSLGGRWSYDVLGWGGYWGWDPVENAALMPWIAATAFLHSVIVQERRGMFRIWNMALIALTFSLVIVGTFLTRAGLVSSVHSFAQSDIGPYFLVFTAVVVVGSLLLLWSRLPDLRSRSKIESPYSRESAFLVNNVVFMGALFGVFWGTLFPLVSEILTEQRVTVGPPYFNLVVMPLFGAAVALMAVGPLTSWRRSDPARLVRSLAGPTALSLLAVALLLALGVREWVALIGFGVCLVALAVTVREYARGVRARMAHGEGPVEAMMTLFRRNRRRYGGYLVHLGVVLLGIGIIGTNIYQVETEQTLDVGSQLQIGDYTLTHRGLGLEEGPDQVSVLADLEVVRDGAVIGELAPRRDFFRLREDQPMTIPSVLHRPMEDLYTMLGVYDVDTQRVTIKAIINPLISFVWMGMLTLVLGTVVAAWPDLTEERALESELRRLMGEAQAVAR
ncbi:MAG: heme lyase CcmF/NrfE family subunit [Anaerolineae bacterium]